MARKAKLSDDLVRKQMIDDLLKLGIMEKAEEALARLAKPRKKGTARPYFPSIRKAMRSHYPAMRISRTAYKPSFRRYLRA